MNAQQLGLPVPAARQLADALEQFLTAVRAGGRPDRDPDAPLLHSYERAAKILDVSKRTVEQLVADGELETVKVRSLPRIPHPSLLAYIDRSRADTRRGVA